MSLVAIPTATLLLILLLDFRRNRECITTYCPVRSLKCFMRAWELCAEVPKCPPWDYDDYC
ncbi:hypothetical protein [Vulcanisaeta sp. JCM 16161]|uniref:hypothetical protein n=1 Tax=Vulcanisaeta sp. JCM 16161 TaxID=1295372 RepID=UPI001FB2BB82|nr:hypothetical protein [Vulcanisaeta sp. JCM 16161]